MLVEMAMRASGRPLGSSGTIAAVKAASSDAYRSAGGGAYHSMTRVRIRVRLYVWSDIYARIEV